MKTIKRLPICRILTEQQRKWLDSRCCPVCGLPKSEWKRRDDWTCCSKECSIKYQECFKVWQYWKVKIFLRDRYTCVKCGYEGREEKIIYPLDEEYYNKEYIIFKKEEVKDGLKVILGSSLHLIADHIKPIALGGEEYELDNVQTLCIKCNKIKTKEDIKKIALYRRQDKNQSQLNTTDGIPPKPKDLGILPTII